MISLLYNAKCSFNNESVTFEDRKYDLTWALESLTENASEPDLTLNIIEEEHFYNSHKDCPESLVDFLKDCYELEGLQKQLVAESLSTSLQGFSDSTVIPICEFTNWRLVWEPERRSMNIYLSAYTAEDIMKLLDINKRQLQRYVATGKLREVLSPKIDEPVRYNPLDVELIQYTLGKGDW